MIHNLSDCLAKVPDSTNVWQYTVILPEAKIGENCNICCHCFIENAMIGAGSVVTKNIPANELWVGNPARFVKKI